MPTIRAGTEADMPSILVLWHIAESRPSTTDTEEALHLLLNRDPESLLVAEIDDEIVGSLIVAWDGWRGSFYRLAVHPEWRRRGVATALVRAGEDRLRRLGAVRLTAIVDGNETTATAFWESVDYQHEAEQNRLVRMLSDANAR